GPPTSRSWKRSGSLPRCGPEGPTPTHRWHWTLSTTATATEANPGLVAGRASQTAGSHGRTGLAAGRDGLRDIVIDALSSAPAGRDRLSRHRRGSCPGW